MGFFSISYLFLIREHSLLSDVSVPFRGSFILLITASLISISFVGFNDLVGINI
ncbi:MAG: hypothetical protein U0T58_00530 [Buchnera aphidicola (Meitanaphis elongallis)]